MWQKPSTGRRCMAVESPRTLAGPASSDASGAEHFARLIRLIEIEREAEGQRAVELAPAVAAEAERTGHALIDLVILDEEAGLGGRYLFKLAKRRRRRTSLDAAGLGSPVVLSPDGPTQELAAARCRLRAP